jgi:hypothetical protein
MAEGLCVGMAGEGGGGCRGVVLKFSRQGLDFGPEEGGFCARRVLCFEEGFVPTIICVCLLKEGFQRVFHPEKAFSLGTSRVRVIRSHCIEVVVRLAPEFFVSSLGIFQVLREAFNAAIHECESVHQVPAYGDSERIIADGRRVCAEDKGSGGCRPERGGHICIAARVCSEVCSVLRVGGWGNVIL